MVGPIITPAILKRSLYFIGTLLGFVGVVFVFMRLGEYVKQMDFSEFGVRFWGVILSLALVYGFANILLARAWWFLLLYFQIKSKWVWALKAYGRSQLAKYMPGNIFHLAGRQALGVAEGFPGWALAKSAAWEIGVIVTAGVLFSFLVIPFIWTELTVWLSVVIYFYVLVLAVALLKYRISPFIARAFGFQTIFLFVSGGTFVSVLILIDSNTITLGWLSAFCGAYVIAWLAGLITPGAPAGVGVRELVLLFLLKYHVAEADLLLAVVIGRLITVFGDLFFFIGVNMVNSRINAQIER